MAEPGAVAAAAARPAPNVAGATAAARPPAAEEEPPDSGTLAPDARAGAVWRRLELLFLRADRGLQRVLPERLNPLLHTGAVAMLALVVALASGVLLLFWYRPSLHLAWSSVGAMGGQPWGAGLLRSLHRYSSDLAMAATAVHALRLFLERRFTGPRWLPWLTGVVAVGTIWFVGWTGYWLVWDTRAHAVAVGTARLLDVLPIFADPMGRSFLTDHGLNSLIFFVVFFAHMLVPLLTALLLWLHVVRIARPRWIARGVLAMWALALMIALSAIRPADLAPQARMTALRGEYAMDAWYLAPLALTDRLPGGWLWLVALAPGVVLAAVPWWMARRRQKKATIYAARCTACEQCVNDCPYDAISMVPRSVGPVRYPLQAEVNPARCVGCGICAASCDGFGTDLVGFSSVPEMRRAEGWAREAIAMGRPPLMVFACTHAAGVRLDPDPETGRCTALPDARVLEVPCGGWVHSTVVERMLRVGAARVAIVTCSPGACHYREGVEGVLERMGGDRHPHFRPEQAPRERVHVLSIDRSRPQEAVRALTALADGAPTDHRPSKATAAAAAAVLAAAIAWGVGAASEWRYSSPPATGSELVVTFKHPGQVSERSRVLTEAEKAKLPVHMRRDRIYERARAPVRMRVTVDGRAVVDRTYPPKGIWKDGNSVAIERIPLVPGTHEVEVAIGDTHDEGTWNHRDRRVLTFTGSERHVLSFDRVSGFRVD